MSRDRISFYGRLRYRLGTASVPLGYRFCEAYSFYYSFAVPPPVPPRYRLGTATVLMGVCGTAFGTASVPPRYRHSFNGRLWYRLSTASVPPRYRHSFNGRLWYRVSTA